MFRVFVNGKEVYKSKQRVYSVGLESARGELARAGVDDTDGAVELVTEEVKPGDPRRRDIEVEETAAADNKAREGKERSEKFGDTGYTAPAEKMNQPQ
jgi:hypothetical protein